MATRIQELDPEAKVLPKPMNFKGLVLVRNGRFSRDELVEQIAKNVVEAEKIMPIDKATIADPNIICEEIKDIVTGKIDEKKSFAVKTTRRGKHEFTSIDVNVIVGDCIRKYTGASVNLRYPDVIVYVEIIGKTAYISVMPGHLEYHKYSPEKKELYKLFSRIAVVQMPYLGLRAETLNISNMYFRVE
ncbi:THUMP domain-containing protein [Staphylothermus hellenicus]|uniref:THUMP domain-containing protein n=1 Tax=Staphylothermus hellenicus TaxID=84599 RepID=UPI0001C4596E|nr:THUMP domain-containing protein [Staphylothermus hellenicus]